MKNIIKKTMQALLLVPVIALGVSVVAPQPAAYAANENCSETDLSIKSGSSCAQGNDQQADLFGSSGLFKIITNVLLFIIGAISVIMLIIGGIRYTVSGGDSAAVTSAKNTILYAIVGIIVALLAFAIVNFVLTQFAGNSA